MLEHGGKLNAAAAAYGIAPAGWLDLSTGINPIPFAPPPIPVTAWAHLPQEHDGLEQAAATYYGTRDILPVAGSQAAIQALPHLRNHSKVGVLHPGYAEHAHAWRNAGHEVADVNVDAIDNHLNNISVLVLMQPNNPNGVVFSHAQLNAWHAQLAQRGGWLIVDEAFIEASIQASAIQTRMPQGLIVLRSLGKFFGLAGARVGFVSAHPALLESMRELLGPWCISGASRLVAQAALLDNTWQLAARARLLQDGVRLAQVLHDAGFSPAGGCGLFQWVISDQAERIHQRLARQAILTRLFAQPRSLRFGLPATAADWQRLRAALEHTA